MIAKPGLCLWSMLVLIGSPGVRGEESSEFAPPEGRSRDVPRDAGSLGPWCARILVATSNDGRDFSRANRAGCVVCDQADVPCAVVAEDGEIWLYFVTWAREFRNRIIVARSRDLEAWDFEPVRVRGLDRDLAIPSTRPWWGWPTGAGGSTSRRGLVAVEAIPARGRP